MTGKPPRGPAEFSAPLFIAGEFNQYIAIQKARFGRSVAEHRSLNSDVQRQHADSEGKVTGTEELRLTVC